eukprot:m.124289 g.124289  ORF g.124289 m.124289 type:complete len:500 (-) comp11150_c6_seq2:881-2380(-)
MSKVAKLHIRQPDDDEVEHERLLNEDDHNGNYEDDGDDILHQSVGDARRGSLDAPRDAYNAAYMIFYLQGLGTLIPWNAFITVNAYFDEKLEQSHYKNNVLPYFTTSFQIVNILLLVFATKVMGEVPMRVRIGLPMFIQLIVFVGILIMVKSDIEGDNFFYATLALVIISAAMTSFFQGGLFGLSGMLPFTYTQAMMGGQGLGGVVVAVMNLITLVFIDDAIHAAYIFFLVAVVVLIFCNISFYILLNLPIVKWYVAHGNQLRDAAKDVNGVKRRESAPPLTAWEIVVKIAPMSCSVFAVFAVTLAVFPSVAVTIVSQHAGTRYGDRLFVPIYCFVVFNVTDLLGRTLAGRVKWPSESEPFKMKWPTIGRLAFIPLFLMCNVHTGLPSADHDVDIVPRVFTSDAVPYILMALLGLSNGYWATLCMMYGPVMVEPKDGERAGSIMLLFLVLGLGFGSFLAFVLLAIACNCNSFLGAIPDVNATTAAPSAAAVVGAFGSLL